MAEISYDIPEHLPDMPALSAAAQGLLAIPDEVARAESVAVAFRLLHGVLSAPDDERKRRVKKTNATFHQKLGRHAAGLEFLRGIGFSDCDDQEAADPQAGMGAILYMKTAFPARLTDGHHTLAKLAHESGLPVPPLPGGGFNPYASTTQKSDTTKVLLASAGYKAESERLREEVKKRELTLRQTVDEAPAVDMQPTAFWLSAGRRLEEVVRSTASLDADHDTDASILKDQLVTVKSALKGSEHFQNANKRKLAELSRMRAYATCVLRVICPDKSVLQAHFRSADPGKTVLARLAPLFAPQVLAASWYIYQSPPLKRLAPEDTLAKAGLGAGANMYLGFDGTRPEPPFLAAGLAAALGSPPGGEGANAPPEAAAGGQGTVQKPGEHAPLPSTTVSDEPVNPA